MTGSEVRELLDGAELGETITRDDGESVPGMSATGHPGWRFQGLGSDYGETLWHHPEHGYMLRRLRMVAAGSGPVVCGFLSEPGPEPSGSAEYIPVEVVR